MTVNERRSPIQSGEPAPDFTLPEAGGAGSVSLAQYRGKSPIYLALFRGLYCSFCRRHIVMLGSIADKLQAVGVQTVGVVATEPERAQFYFRFRPPRMAMGADPELLTHHAYGLPNVPLTPGTVKVARAAAARELRRLNQEVTDHPLAAFRRLDGYEPTELDQAEQQRHQHQLTGQFLIDRNGVVRYTYVEGAGEGLAEFDMPSEEEILAAAQGL
jgi:peroxiredoxin